MLSVVFFLSSTMTYIYLYIILTSLFISSFHYLPFLIYLCTDDDGV